ncbi:hypothetical protein J3F84DRAFT_19836 [Trichoderma pleuroticola]
MAAWVRWTGTIFTGASLPSSGAFCIAISINTVKHSTCTHKTANHILTCILNSNNKQTNKQTQQLNHPFKNPHTTSLKYTSEENQPSCTDRPITSLPLAALGSTTAFLAPPLSHQSSSGVSNLARLPRPFSSSTTPDSHHSYRSSRS